MEYLKLIETIVASDLVRNILLLMIMLGIWKVQDIISSVIMTDIRNSSTGTYNAEAIRVNTGD